MTRRSPLAAAVVELVLDRAEVLEALTHRLGGDEPAEALAGRDQAVLPDQLERPSHRHPAGAELGGQLGLAGQQRPGRGGAARARSSAAISW